MIIAIDGYEANQTSRVGIGRYAFEILNHIYNQMRDQKAKGLKKEIIFRIYLPTAPLIDMPKETSWWTYRVVGPQKLWTFIGLPLALHLDSPKAHVVFSPTHYIPRFTSISRVMSIMDLSYIQFPELFKPKDLHQLVHWTAYAATHAKKIFTISHASADDIIKTYNKKSEDVVVTYPGFSLTNRSTYMTKQDIQSAFELSKDYVLTVGTIQPRKNYIKLIEAFAQLRETKKISTDIQLVIVGKKGWLYEDILAAPKKYGVENVVVFLDFVTDEQLPDLYKHAVCFCLPSLYEGFGLPVLEAMAYECPVVVSDVSSLPEIAADAAIYVKPESVESIAQGLQQAIAEHATEKEKHRVKKGLEQVKKFSWEKAARQTLDILEEVGGVSS